MFLTTIASGTIDAYRILRHDLHGYTMYSNEELELVTWAKQNTLVNSIWLTGNNHNHWLYNLTGRQAVMTYPGWLWTHGYDYLPVQRDIQLMYQQPMKYKSLFKQYKIDYIMVDPSSRRNWQVNLDELSQVGTLIKQTKNYLMYELK